jgi:uncharacterized protein (DUF433 family)
MNDWIVSNAEVLGGKPCVGGTRISVEFLLELLAGGATPAEILQSYPQLTRDSLVAAFQYAAESMRSEVVWDVKVPA